jgi:uroporphyrinogen decarboxylase
MSTFNDTFLKACRGETTDYTPIWIMRQAGRYQPEYRKIRQKYTLVEICKHPEVCTKVTLLPVQQLKVDAAILFSDIMIPLDGMGISFEIKENIGPVIKEPIKSLKDIKKIHAFDANIINYTGTAVSMLRKELSVPLIGFSGAPFTLASYLIEGGPSKNFIKTKTMMYSNPDDWNLLMKKLADGMFEYLKYQVECGAQALQVFDSWVGNLTIEDYKTYILPHMKALFLKLKTLNVPIIHFGFNASHLLELIQEAGGDVIGIDWRTDISDAHRRLFSSGKVKLSAKDIINSKGKYDPGDQVYEFKNPRLQGNLDPVVLFAPSTIIEEKAKHILDSIPQRGHIFNLGHGILPNTDVSKVQHLVDLVHQYKRN